MKIIVVCLLYSAFYLVQTAPAEDAPSPQVFVNTAEISEIEFYTGSGGLSFTAAGQQYILPGRSVAGGLNDASVAANLAVLNELRHATKVMLVLRDAASAKPPHYLDGVSFRYDSLK